MAGRGCLFHMGLVPVLLVLVRTMLCAAGASAQSSSTCTSALVSLSPCLNYITGNDTNPSSSCCSQLASVVQSEPQCLCMVLDGGTSSLGISVNETQAMALPTACKVQTPPVSKCNSTGSPTTPSSSTPAAPGSPAGGDESKTLDASGGSDTRVAAASTIIYSLLFAVASLCMTSVTF